MIGKPTGQTAVRNTIKFVYIPSYFVAVANMNYFFWSNCMWGGMDFFRLHNKIVRGGYANHTSSFIEIAEDRNHNGVNEKFASGLLWPDPLLQHNPSFASGGSLDGLVRQNVLHPLCGEIFRLDKTLADPHGKSM